MLMIPTLTRCCTVLGLALILASPAAAQRPSLIDLQAAVDGLISPAPAAVGGKITFTDGSGLIEFDVVDFALSAERAITCSASCQFSPVSYSLVQVTVVASPDAALLSGRLSSLASQTVRVLRPPVPPERDPARLVDFENAEFETIDDASVPGRVVIQFNYQTISIDLGGQRPGWDRLTNQPTNSDCSGIPINQVHVDLADNDVTNLQVAEIESTQRLTVSRSGAQTAVSVTYSRKPPNACYLIGVLGPEPFDVSFEKLWTNDDLFSGRHSIETIDLVDVFLQKWTFRMDSGIVTEDVVLSIQPPPFSSGSQTLRAFDDVTGAETSSQAFGF